MRIARRLVAAASCAAAVAGLCSLTAVPAGQSSQRDLLVATSWAARVVAGYLGAAFVIALVEVGPAEPPWLPRRLRPLLPSLVRTVAQVLAGTAAAGCVATAAPRATPTGTAAPAATTTPSRAASVPGVQPALPPLAWPGPTPPLTLPTAHATAHATAHTTAHTSADPPAGPAPSRAVVVVRPGDSLWSIAAGALGPRPTNARVALAWPRWWSTNRAVIGPDPDLILPGQRLLAPADETAWRTA
jgi:hypothetical protein